MSRYCQCLRFPAFSDRCAYILLVLIGLYVALFNSASKATSGWFQRQQSKSGNEEKEEKQKTNKNAKDRSDEAETNVTEASSESEPERLATTSEKLSDEDERKQDGEGDQIETSDEVRKPKEAPNWWSLLLVERNGK